jgi:hypothetical protein
MKCIPSFESNGTTKGSMSECGVEDEAQKGTILLAVAKI